MTYRDAALEAALHRVSVHCLGGAEVPATLRAWWSLALRPGGAPGLADLLRPIDHERLVDERALLDGPTTPEARRLAAGALAELTLIAEGVVDGLLALGYWRHGGATELERCPVVGIDDEGQMVLLGRSLADALAARIGWEPDRVARLAALRAALALEGVSQRTPPEELFEAMRSDPELARPFRALALRWNGVAPAAQ